MNKLEDSLSIDRYAITTSLSLFHQRQHDKQSYFELYFRKPPSSELPGIIFAGTQLLREFLKSVDFQKVFLSKAIKSIELDKEKEFQAFLGQLHEDSIQIESLQEGSFVIPNVPVLTFKGPLAYLLILEAPFLCLINLASSAATTAFIFKKACPNKQLVDMGLRRSYGVETARVTSFYASLSGFTGSSNMAVESMLGENSYGTMSHAFILSFEIDPSLETIHFSPEFLQLLKANSKEEAIQKVLIRRKQLGGEDSSLSELKSFLSFASRFPKEFICLVDTYDAQNSGIVNFAIVASFLDEAGFERFGMRLDSGDLLSLSIEARNILKSIDKKFKTNLASKSTIIASNDINLDFLKALQSSPNEIDSIGIGTNLASFSVLKPIGFVFKLAQIEEIGLSKKTSDAKKATLPYKKTMFKASKDKQIYFVLAHEKEELVQGVSSKIFLVESKTNELKRISITFDHVEKLLEKRQLGFDQKAYKNRISQAFADFESTKSSEIFLAYTEELNEKIIHQKNFLK